MGICVKYCQIRVSDVPVMDLRTHNSDYLNLTRYDNGRIFVIPLCFLCTMYKHKKQELSMYRIAQLTVPCSSHNEL